MSSEWRELTLGDVTTWSSGGTPKKDVSEYWGGKIPWISANSMHGTRFNHSDLKITELGLQNGSRIATKDSVLLLVRGGALHSRIPVGIATQDVAFNQDVKALKAKEEFISPWFLLFWLMAHEKFLLETVVEYTGIGAGKLDTKRMQSIPFQVPPTWQMKAIEQVAKSLDDRINLLYETNKTLEAISSAIFKSWFIDFDPVKANSGNQAPSLPAEIQALFPSCLVKSTQGLIPDGWKLKPLDEIAQFLNGLALQKYPPNGIDDLPVIKIAQLRKGDTDGAAFANSSIKPEYVINNGDIIFSWSGSLLVDIWCGGVGALNQHLFKVTSEHFPKWFYLLWTKQHLPHFQQIAANKATTMGHIQRKHLSEANVVVPSTEVLNEADKLLAPLIEKIINNAVQARNLTDLRNTLLPRLISGKLKMKVTPQPR